MVELAIAMSVFMHRLLNGLLLRLSLLTSRTSLMHLIELYLLSLTVSIATGFWWKLVLRSNHHMRSLVMMTNQSHGTDRKMKTISMTHMPPLSTTSLVTQLTSIPSTQAGAVYLAYNALSLVKSKMEFRPFSILCRLYQ
jgi:hypothetical protein